MATRRAVVVGIDGYANPDWRLDGAVRDALAFADWVLKAGGVAPGGLRLLLSPLPGAPPPAVPAGVPAPLPATSQGIIGALAELRRLKAEEGGDRVYVYYAGHGAALPQWNAEPVLIPVDFTDPELHGQLLLGFSRIIPYLTPAPFPEQLFFLDACRDFGLPGYEPPLQSPVGPYRPVRGAVRQYVFYSVAPGQRAVQIGTGIWTQTFLDALEGRSYQPVARHGGAYEVSLSHLAAWIRGEVSKRITNTFLRDAAKLVQTPEYVPDPAGGDPVLVTYTDQTVPRAKIDVFVEPGVALRTCRVSVKQYVDGLGREIEVAAGPAPPLAPPVPFELRPADYSIQAEADDYVLASRPWTVDDEPQVELTLEAARAAGPVTIAAAEPQERGLRDVDLEDFDFVRDGASLRGAFGTAGDFDDQMLGGEAPEPTRSGRTRRESRPGRREPVRRVPPADLEPSPSSLTVSCPDPAVRIELLDAKRQTVRERVEPGTALPLAPGIYRLRARVPGEPAGEPPVESTVEVRPGRAAEIRLSVPAARLGMLQLRWLQDRGIDLEPAAGKSAYLHPSELLGPVAGARFGSLLAYAAYAANWSGSYFQRLRAFGVPPFPAAGADACGVLTLVGVAGGREPDEIADFLGGCRVALHSYGGGSLGESAFSTLPGMPAAAASQTVLGHPGGLSAELRLPGFGATRYALAALPGRITVLVAVLESDGRVDVQQLLLPLVPGAAPAWREFLADPDDLNAGAINVRKVDLALRAFAAGEEQPLEAGDLDDLLAGRRTDPLLACAAGYSLARAGRPESSALANLLHLFPELPDAWVLAGLCDPERRVSWFEQAGRRGVPLFAEGLRALGQAGDRALGVSEAAAGLLPGSSWTAWTVPGAR
jgi:Caspase domain